MRSYFIDYCQLFLPIAREGVYNNDVKLSIKKSIIKNLFDESLKTKLIENPELSINQYIRMVFNHGGLILSLYGKYFKTLNFCENVSQVIRVGETIYNNHKEDFDFNRVTISRLDIACNLPMFLNTHAYKYHKTSIEKIKRWYTGKSKRENLTGIAIGNRGKYACQLTAYDKRYSPNKADDLSRLSTYNYTRLEYKIGRRYLRKNLSVDDLKDFRRFEDQFPNHLIGALRKSKDLSFIDEKKYSRYYTFDDYNQAIGKTVEDEDAEMTMVESRV
ncbi:MAG: hypothetical protein QGG04_09190 [Candidatus Marinimicrobia bacterium]|jgi:hypothetical protein|nr:hypothetical protein [Candidatus Neomarinimicrobiota bacterium]|tara:strand:- start:66 stop:887 length:822 start_codon:yes stop_codon:yes gene_type:complete